MLCPLQVESNQLYVVCLFETARDMIPKNDRQPIPKELSWMDRMQLKLESLCETEAARNPNHLVQETSAYLEKQMTTVGTNMRKFCAEFVKEMLLPDTPDKVEVSQVDTLQADLGQHNSLQTGTEIRLSKPAKLMDAPVFDPEGSISGSSLEENSPVTEVQHAEEANPEALPLLETTIKPSIPEETPLLRTVSEQSLQRSVEEGEADQYAQWFVSEEYRRMTLGKSASMSSLESSDGLERSTSSDSLRDWELV